MAHLPREQKSEVSNIHYPVRSNLTQRCKRFATSLTSTQVAVLPWHYVMEVSMRLVTSASTKHSGYLVRAYLLVKIHRTEESKVIFSVFNLRCHQLLAVYNHSKVDAPVSCLAQGHNKRIFFLHTFSPQKNLFSPQNKRIGFFSTLSRERPVVVFFTAGYNGQAFTPKPWKNIWRRSILSFLRKTQNCLTPTLTSPIQKLDYSNNQLNC